MHVVCEKGAGTDLCAERKNCEISDSFTNKQRKQLATPLYRTCREHQKKVSSLSFPLVDSYHVTVLLQVENKVDSSHRDETPSKKPKKSSHKSPSRKISKASKTTDIQTDLKYLAISGQSVLLG